MKIRSLLACAALFFVPLASNAASCRANVTVSNFWEEKNGFIMKANLDVEVEGQDIGMVNIFVEARFHYEREDGFSSTDSTVDTFYVDTDETSSKTHVIDTTNSMCSKERSCTINDVEIKKVTCRD